MGIRRTPIVCFVIQNLTESATKQVVALPSFPGDSHVLFACVGQSDRQIKRISFQAGGGFPYY